MGEHATKVEVTLPDWVEDYTRGVTHIPALEDRMRFVIDAAKTNVLKGTGGPFAAAIFERDSGRLVALGVNRVTTENSSILHAEMVAFLFAQKALGHYDLGGEGNPAHELVTSTEPCAMCFGAIPWSGVRRVVTGARDEDARAIGFDEGPKPESWQAALAERGITAIPDTLRAEAAGVLKMYCTHGGHLYNSRESDD